MATSVEYMEYICDQIRGIGDIRYKKMFGEYMLYVNDKPILLVCDSTVYVKCLDCIAEQMKNEQTGIPYTGSKAHYILDIDNKDFSKDVILSLEKVIPLPKPRKKI
ncbi:transcriptional regulator [Alkalibaculum sp. M08DMB]|uniref:Transcriptional regulator n=1 Tax=Alkalibaculum sporogenes TaxID=2655001 RepID=A0A6A7KC32_9FIRM|nr:TfoX/Sxy family protein [Alkalibaculum sporogenes]MPW26737.1 transcriptional regulator [Alkalibaculum sporogenes]